MKWQRRRGWEVRGESDKGSGGDEDVGWKEIVSGDDGGGKEAGRYVGGAGDRGTGKRGKERDGRERRKMARKIKKVEETKREKGKR